MSVFMLYELTVLPGKLDQVRALLDEWYVPNAQARGLQLERMCVTPPLVLDDEPTTLVLWWSLPDAAAVWSMKRQGDPLELLARWSDIDALLVSRGRRFLLPVDELVNQPSSSEH